MPSGGASGSKDQLVRNDRMFHVAAWRLICSNLPGAVKFCVNAGNHERDAPATGDRFYPLQSRTDSGVLQRYPTHLCCHAAGLVHPDMTML